MEKNRLDLSAFDLKLLAMAAMLADHIGYLFFPQALWMRCVGRLAFPIFAFQVAEGWYRTCNRRRYFLRLALCGLLSEIPFDLAIGGQPIDPGYQNVLWTFCIAAAALWAMEALQRRLQIPLPLAALPAAGAGYLLGEALQSDYFGARGADGAGVRPVPPMAYRAASGAGGHAGDQRLAAAQRRYDPLGRHPAGGAAGHGGPAPHLAVPGPSGPPRPLAPVGMVRLLPGPPADAVAD